MPSFKVYDTAGNPAGDYPSYAKMLGALRRFEPDGAAWVEDDTGRRSLYLVSSVGISQVTSHVVEMIQQELKVKLAAATQDVVDAKKWRTFLKSGRIRVLGCAGLTPEHPSYAMPYAHIGLEVWNTYPGADPEETVRSREILEAYVEKLTRCPAIIPGTEG